jgi:hypothetical protein
MTTKAEKEKALQEFKQTQNIVLLQKRLGHKHIRSTLNLLGRTDAFKLSAEDTQ